MTFFFNIQNRSPFLLLGLVVCMESGLLPKYLMFGNLAKAKGALNVAYNKETSTRFNAARWGAGASVSEVVNDPLDLQ